MQDSAILIERDRIATMIPHAGEMCLLDGVLVWDAISIRCLSRRYQNKDNPMRRANGTLGMACGIEIAAQAMAVHARLAAGDNAAPSRGYLASVRDVWLAAPFLDTVAGDLMIEAERLMGDPNGAAYRFLLTREGVELLGGRATVILGADV
jgi:predicted hotdog family 3-hydroxylacyl-ACP dehydratase